ncbi:c-type cytochrome [Sandaracinobacteroides saxicola]|uniref:Cytochrome c family protein n=1 Tax=Sandaracinobacteroides saxicola TaxID=2759707 RepID=A0A7G5IKU7_9SPHN|nr:cytochrome c family protein [Sandaracinobacteroides saxicola]QMW23989.1 cytochrome c family protein [Sandaracinobacteroides saxicola]
MRVLPLLFALAAAPVSAQAMPKGDAAAGKAVFVQCSACHSLKPGQNKIGPSLARIIGRKSGSVPNFKYSKANASSGIVWTEANLFKYLENPRRTIPGTTMAFAGIKDPQRRANLIAFLKANGG